MTPTPVVGGLSFVSLDAFNNNSIVGTTCGLTASGDAWCWGANQGGQLGAPSNDTCTSSNITVDCSLTPVPVGGGVTFRKIAVGLEHVCAFNDTNVAWCWGSNDMGQLGDGSLTNSPTPIRVQGLRIPQQIGSIVVSPATGLIRFLEGTLQFTAQALDEDGVQLATQPTFSFTSSNVAVAPIDASGLATGLTNGQTIITATAPDGATGRAVLGVNIIDPAVAFRQAWSGFSGAPGVDGIVVLGGLLSDEWSMSGTFPTRYEVDRRQIASDNVTVQGAYDALVLARTALETEIARLLRTTPTDARLGQMRALNGYIHLAFAENFCSGVPRADANVGQTTSELLSAAAALFNEAMTGPVAEPYLSLAKVGTGRAQLGLGNFAAAAVAAAGVPNGFAYGTTHSATGGEQNFVYAMNTLQRRITLAEGEGVNGLTFRSAGDPRVPWMFGGTGFNGGTPLYLLLKYPSAASQLTFASDREARLIEAEATVNAGDAVGFMATLNALRAAGGLTPLVDPGNPSARVDLLFRERAFWLFASGSRLGDLRRLVRQYGRSTGSVFPVGSYPAGGNFGTDANLPVPTSARGPAYTGCTDRAS